MAGVRIADLPDLGAVTDAASVVADLAGSGRFLAPALRTYMGATFATSAALATEVTARIAAIAAEAAARIAAQVGVSVKQSPYNAVGDGLADDTAAIQAALNTGKSVFLPEGSYKVSSALTVSGIGQNITGASNILTIISTNSTTADIFSVTAQYVQISRLGLTASVTKTAGAFINAVSNNNFCEFHDLTLTSFYRGIIVGGVGGATNLHISQSRFLYGVAGTSVGILVNSGADVLIRDVWILGISAIAQMSVGIVIAACGGCVLDQVQTVWTGTGLEIAPAIGAIVQTAWVVDCEFDSNTGAGISVQAAGIVQLLKILGTWAASNAGGGIILNTSGGGAIQQTDIATCDVAGNTGIGIHIATAGVSHTRIMGCTSSANTTNGIQVDAAVNYLTISDCKLGQTGEFAANGGYGAVLAAGITALMCHDNTVDGNTAGSLSIGTPAGLYGSAWFVCRNTTFVTQASGMLVTTAGPSSFVVSHGLSVTPALSDIQLTLNSAPGTATYFYATTVTATTFTITFNAAPGAGVNVSWTARTWGA